MAEIADRTVQSVTTRVLKLQGECYTRKHTLGSNWNVARFGFRQLWSLDPGVGQPVVNPRMGFGICEHAGVGDGVAFDAASGQRAIGVSTVVTGVTRGVSGTVSYWEPASQVARRMRNDNAGVAEVDLGVVFRNYFVETVEAWFPWVLEVDLSGASASVTAMTSIIPATASTTAIHYKGITLAQFQAALQASTMADVVTAINTYHTANGGGAALCQTMAVGVPSAFASQANRDACKVGVFVSSQSPTVRLEIDDITCFKVS